MIHYHNAVTQHNIKSTIAKWRAGERFVESTMQGVPYLRLTDDRGGISAIVYVPEDFEGWDLSLAQLLMLTTIVHVIFY